MNPQSPPWLATWLLRKLTSGYCAESLEGDLLEGWRSGRGNAWYWRQVFVAVIVSTWRIARVHGLTFALAVTSFWVTIWLSRFGNHEVLPLTYHVRRAVFEGLGPTPFSLSAGEIAGQATERLWFAVVFITQGYVIGRLHRHYVKTAALTALAIFILLPNLPLFEYHLTRTLHGNANLDALSLATFFIQNIVCVLFGAAWVAKRWPQQKARPA